MAVSQYYPRHPPLSRPLGLNMKRILPRRRSRRGSVAVHFLAAALCAALSAHALILPLGNGQKNLEKREIAKMERQWRTALLGGDTAALDTLISDTYVGIGPNGTIFNKAEEIQSTASGENRFQRLHLEERKIRIYGTTAVVTSKVLVQGFYANQPVLGEYRYTRVWSLENGQWRVVCFEANRVNDSTSRRE
jgi:ketosteroid isomerase-like protein